MGVQFQKVGQGQGRGQVVAGEANVNGPERKKRLIRKIHTTALPLGLPLCPCPWPCLPAALPLCLALALALPRPVFLRFERISV